MSIWPVYLLAAAGLAAAVVAFLRTPADKRFSMPSQPPKQPGVEYAEEVTKRDRMRALVVALGIGLPVMGLLQFWGLPALDRVGDTAQCHPWLGTNGLVWLIYASFVGMPLLAALAIGVPCAWSGLRVLRDGQYPPIGHKVYRPTKILRGRRAATIGTLQLAVLPLILGLTVWMTLVAGDFVADLDPARAGGSHCPAARNSGQTQTQ